MSRVAFTNNINNSVKSSGEKIVIEIQSKICCVLMKKLNAILSSNSFHN